MLPGNNGRFVNRAGIADLGRTRIALQQKGLWPGAGGTQCPKEECKKEQPRGVALKGAQSEAASINDSIS
jgi:hypothetical protein